MRRSNYSTLTLVLGLAAAVMLAQILIGRPVFDSTEELIRRNGAFTRLRDVNHV